MLVVEDGSGNANAESYVAAAELRDYANKRGLTVIADLDDVTLEALLIRAMDYLETQPWSGSPDYAKQALAFPRLGVVPGNIKKAQLALAVIAHQRDLLPNSTVPGDALIASKQVGSVRVSYHNSGYGQSAYSAPLFPEIASLIAEYVAIKQAVLVRT